MSGKTGKGAQAVRLPGGEGSSSGVQIQFGAPILEGESESSEVRQMEILDAKQMTDAANRIKSIAARLTQIWIASDYVGFVPKVIIQTYYTRCLKVYQYDKKQANELLAEFAVMVLNRGVALVKARGTMEESEVIDDLFTKKEELAIYDNLDAAGDKSPTTLTLGRLMIAFAPLVQNIWNQFGNRQTEKFDPQDISGLPMSMRWNGSQGFIGREYWLNALVFHTRLARTITGDRQGNPTKTPFEAWRDVVKYFGIAQNGIHPYKEVTQAFMNAGNKDGSGAPKSIDLQGIDSEATFNAMFPHAKYTFNVKGGLSAEELNLARTWVIAA